MTNDGSSTPDGADLAELREQIDELKSIPTEELVNPVPHDVAEDAPEAEPTDAIGSEEWNEPASDEVTEL